VWRYADRELVHAADGGARGHPQTAGADFDDNTVRLRDDRKLEYVTVELRCGGEMCCGELDFEDLHRGALRWGTVASDAKT
jgi:hypothetical protein